MMKVLSNSTDNKGISSSEYREILYYNKYAYKATIRNEGIRFMYRAANINQWVDRVTNRYYNWTAEHMTETERIRVLSNEPFIKQLISYRNKLKEYDDVTCRQETNTFSIYTNNLLLLTEINNWESSVKAEITECKLYDEIGTKYFVRQPKNNYRVYLKSVRVSVDVATQLEKTFDRQPTLNPSKSLKKWINFVKNRAVNKNTYCCSTYHIDYDEESMLSYLSLCHGDILGKTYKLTQRK